MLMSIGFNRSTLHNEFPSILTNEFNEQLTAVEWFSWCMLWKTMSKWRHLLQRWRIRTLQLPNWLHGKFLWRRHKTIFFSFAVNIFFLIAPLLVNPCDPNPCSNNGICSGIGAFSFQCSCLEGFMGTLCEESQFFFLYTGQPRECSNHCVYSLDDPCFSNPCLNSGTCFTLGRTSFCICPSGTEGAFCQFGFSSVTINFNRRYIGTLFRWT